MTETDSPTHRDLRPVAPALLADSPGTVPAVEGYGTAVPVAVFTAKEPIDEKTAAAIEAALSDPYATLEARAGKAEAIQAGTWMPLAPPSPTPAVEEIPAPTAAPGSAGWLHSLACGCGYVDDVEGHGLDFAELAAALHESVAADLPAVPTTAPVEAKVWAGAWGTLAASTGLALVTLLLDRLDVIGDVFGGDYPWVGGLVLILGVVLPPVVSFLRAYLAPHTFRPSSVAAAGSTGGSGVPGGPTAPVASAAN